MKTVNLILTSVSTIIGAFKFDINAPIIDITGDTIINFYNESYYGAFFNESNSMVKFKFSSVTDRHYFCVKYYNQRTNALLVNESYKMSDYLESDRTMEYTIKCKGKLNNDGLRIVFSTENSTGGEKNSKTIRLYPTANETIYSYQYVNTAYVVDERIFKIESESIKSRESVRFENTIDYLTNDAYNAIDISEVTFTYEEGFDLVNKGSNNYLKILDLDNIFPFLNKDSNGYIYIPLICVQNGKDITLKFKNHFYFNPSTLDISTYGRTGFIETEKFYIPKGKLKLLENTTFAVEMNNFGRCKFNIRIPLTFIKDRNYLGLCSDSSHCIIGGIKE